MSSLKSQRAAVGRILTEMGRESQRSGAAQLGSSFSSDVRADELIASDPNAFLFGVLCTQGIRAESAWRVPIEIQDRVGSISLPYLVEHASDLRAAFKRQPALHRFVETVPGWIVSAARRLLDEYAGSAANIWPAGAHRLTVLERLCAFDGIGRKKSVMATEILVRHFGVDLAGDHCGQVAFDVHVRRVLLRSGVATADTPKSIEEAAARMCPPSPGTLDLPAWLIGRQYCRPRQPRCAECPLSGVCARLVEHDPAGVGARR